MCELSCYHGIEKSEEKYLFQWARSGGGPGAAFAVVACLHMLYFCFLGCEEFLRRKKAAGRNMPKLFESVPKILEPLVQIGQ